MLNNVEFFTIYAFFHELYINFTESMGQLYLYRVEKAATMLMSV